MAVVHGRYAITGEGYSTEGQITHVGGQVEGPLDSLMLPMALCADAEIRDGGLVGDPTEGALVVLAAKGGVDPTLTRERYPRVATLPFDAAYKFMATFHRMTDDDGQGGHPGLRQGGAGPAPRRARSRRRAPTASSYPDRPGPRAVPRRERAAGRPGPAGHGHRAAGLRPEDVRPERRPAPAHRRPSAAGARRHRRPAADRGPRRHRQGARGRHPGADDHRRPRDHRRGDRQPAGHQGRRRSRAPSSPRCPTTRPTAGSTTSASSPGSRPRTRSASSTSSGARVTSSP